MADFIGGVGDDTLSGQSENDYVVGGQDNDRLKGGGGEDEIRAGEGNDTVSGEGGDDFVAGGGGDDVIHGGAGNDTIQGGPGNDVMKGGAGADLYLYNDNTPAGQTDYITDFNVDEGDGFLFLQGAKVVGIESLKLGDKFANGVSLQNAGNIFDLKVTIEQEGEQSTLYLVDVMDSSHDVAFWTSYFGL